MRLQVLFRMAAVLLVAAPGALATAYTQASGSTWSTATWSPAGTPGNGDTVTINNGSPFQFDTTVTIGNSPGSNTAVVTATVDTRVNTGVTLTVRGKFTTNKTFTLQAGATIAMDCSAGSAVQYTLEFTASGKFFIANGSSNSHAVFNGSPSGCSAQGYIAGTTNAPGYQGTVSDNTSPATYIDFINCGSSASGCSDSGHLYTNAFSTGVNFNHATWTSSGPFKAFNATVGTQNATQCVFCVTSASLSNGALGAINAAASATGPRVWSDVVLDKRFSDSDGLCSSSGGPRLASGTRMYWGASNCGLSLSAGNGWTISESLIIVPASNPSPLNPSVGAYGDVSYVYVYNNGYNDNPHGFFTQFNFDSTLSNIVYDSPGAITTDQGEFMFRNGNASTGRTQTVSNNVLLPGLLWEGAAALTTCTTTPAAGNTYIFSNNTVAALKRLGGNDSGLMTINEANCTSNTVTYKNNFGFSLGPTYLQTLSYQSTPFATDVLTTIQTNGYDSLRSSTQTSSCTGCTNQANGYGGKWSATPGTSDIAIGTAQITDQYRNLAFWDTRYLQNAVGTAWVTSTAYTVGQIVSVTQSTVYSSTPVNYRCITAHTSAAADKPDSGANWRTYWELASMYDIRTAIAAGTTYTDAHCSACSPVKALITWVQYGFASLNPLSWKTGTGAVDLGAVDIPMVQHIPPLVVIP